MRIIHCADLHLDSKMSSNFNNEQATQRRLEILNTFENMIRFAVENQVKVIIIAGDLFDTCEYVHKKIKDRVIDNIKNNPQIDFLYLKGNHDTSDYFEQIALQIPNLKLFGKHIRSYNYGNICISGVEFSEEIMAEYYNINLDENKFNIFVMHGQESSVFSNNGEELINLTALKNKHIDYLALGHIHKYKFEKLDDRGYYCYSGCLEGRGFDECGEKGFVLLEVNENSFKHGFISNSARTFYEVDVYLKDIENENDIYKNILENVKDIDSKNIVKVNLFGEIEENIDIDIDYLSQKLSQDFYFVKIKDKTTVKINYDLYKNDVSLKGEFVRLLENLDIEDEKKSKIISTGIKALLGKEF